MIQEWLADRTVVQGSGPGPGVGGGVRRPAGEPVRWVPVCLLSLWLCGAVHGADIVEQIVAHVPAQVHSYRQMMAELTALTTTGRVTLTSLGNSVKGRSIVAVAVHSPDAVFGQGRRLFVIARQHGSEPAGTQAAMALIRHFATSQGALEQGTLRRVTLILVPMANPDGADGGRRANANGADLNRDWASQRQPETRAIERAVAAWKPHAIMDLHELPRSSSKPEYTISFLETIGSGPGIAKAVSDHTIPAALDLSGWLKAYGHRANIYYNGAHKDRRLCHRHFGLTRGIPSFLVESKTGAGRSMQQRVSFHVLCMLVVTNHLLHLDGGDPPAPPPTQVAQSPPDTGPCRVKVQFTPSPDGDGGCGSLEAVVTGGQDVRFVRFHLDGQLWMLSNMTPYQCPLDAGQMEEGTHELTVEAVDGQGQVLARYRRQVIVGEPTALAE